MARDRYWEQVASTALRCVPSTRAGRILGDDEQALLYPLTAHSESRLIFEVGRGENGRWRANHCQRAGRESAHTHMDADRAPTVFRETAVCSRPRPHPRPHPRPNTWPNTSFDYRFRRAIAYSFALRLRRGASLWEGSPVRMLRSKVHRTPHSSTRARRTSRVCKTSRSETAPGARREVPRSGWHAPGTFVYGPTLHRVSRPHARNDRGPNENGLGYAIASCPSRPSA